MTCKDIAAKKYRTMTITKSCNSLEKTGTSKRQLDQNDRTPSPLATMQESDADEMDYDSSKIEDDDLVVDPADEVSAPQSKGFLTGVEIAISWLTQHIQRQLFNFTHQTGLQLLAPQGLLEHLAKDIWTSSEKEPGGVSGCVLCVTLQRHRDVLTVSKLPMDSHRPATFELNLKLFEQRMCWFGIKDLISNFAPNLVSSRVVYINPSYELEKYKLYRVNSLTGSIND